MASGKNDWDASGKLDPELAKEGKAPEFETPKRAVPVRPEVRWEEGSQLGYRAAAEDRREWRSGHARAFKQQMWAGTGVGIVAIILWIVANVGTRGESFKGISVFFGSTVLAWTVISVAKYRTGGFVVGLVLSVGVALLITGCGVAAICSGVFR